VGIDRRRGPDGVRAILAQPPKTFGHLCDYLFMARPQVALTSRLKDLKANLERLLSFLVAAIVVAEASSSPALTVGDPQKPGRLQQEILDAYRNGAREITINPGAYVLPSSPGPASLFFANMKDVVISAQKVELSMTAPKDALGFYACENLVFRGAAVHYDHPRFCQARILGFGTDPDKGDYYDAQIDAGYPLGARFRSAYVFDPKQAKIKFRTGDMSARNVEKLDQPGKVRIFWGGHNLLPPAYNVQPGDSVVCRGDGSTLLHADDCQNCTFQDLNLYWGGVFGIFETGRSRGNHYLGICLTRGPVPPGATNAPLISQSADGLHSAAARLGPDIENCTFENMCDDAVAIHGYYAKILVVSNNSLTINRQLFEAGDLARVSSANGFMEEAKVETARRLSNGNWLVTLERPIAAKAGYKAGNPSASGAGYKILHNTIRNNRARGILAKGDDGLIEGNLIEGSTMSGISIGPEGSWGEADYCRNVVVRNNVVTNTDYATNGQGENGAVRIHGDGALGNCSIQIENNRLGSVLGPNLIIEWAAGVKVAGNTFDAAQRKPRGNVQRDQAVIWLEHATDVSLANNQVTGGMPNSDALVRLGRDVTAVTGAKTGLSRN
jgi:hypothetical protein